MYDMFLPIMAAGTPLISTLTDNFTSGTLDTTKWTNNSFGAGAGVTVSGGKLICTPATSTGNTGAVVDSVLSYDLTGGNLTVQVLQIASQNAATYVQLIKDGSNKIFFQCDGGSLKAYQVVATSQTQLATISYNSSTMAWWRIREAAGVTYWEYSADSIAWTELTHATNPIAVTLLSVDLQGYDFSSDSAPGAAWFDNVNLPFTTTTKTQTGKANIVGLLTTLTDPFNQITLNTALWTQFTGGSATMAYDATGATVTYPASSTASTDGDLTTVNFYNLTGGSISMQTLAVPSAATSADGEIRVYTDANNYFRWVYEGGTLFAQHMKASVRTTDFSVAYSAATHKYWKIAESGGVVTWYTSTDGSTYTSRATFTHGMTITKMGVFIGGTCFQAETNPGTFKFNNVNIIVTAQTQAGKARITAATTKTQTAKGRVAVTTPQTQTAKARVGVTTLQTQTAKARVTAATPRTQTAKARITATGTQIQAAKARITATTTKTQTGKARITATTTQTQTGKASIRQRMESLQDDFEFGGIDTGKWSTWGSTTTNATTNLLLELTSTLASNYGGVLSLATFDLTGSYAFAQLVDAGNQSITSLEVYPVELTSGTNALSIMVSGNTVSARKKVAGSYTTVGSSVGYNSTTMKWFRIRESAGTTYWEYAADPTSTWTQIASASNPITVTSLVGGITIGTWQAESSTTTAKVDNFNVLPAAEQFTWKGYTWNKRIHAGDPANNQVWDPGNISVDGSGYLHVKIANPSGASPSGSEVFTAQRGFGYGTYTAVIATELDNIGHPSAFGGMFTFDFTASPDYKEIDVHETRDYNSNPNKRVLHSHVYNNGGVRQFIVDDMDVPSDVIQTHVMTWTASSITFDSYLGTGTGGTNYFHTVHSTHIPTPGLERVHFNTFVDPTITGYQSVAPLDVIIRDFSFTPGGTNTAQTQLGKARITATTTKTQTGKASVIGPTTRTQTGKARITAIGTQTQTGKARIQKAATQTQTGLGRIGLVTTKTQPGKAKIANQVTKAQTGKARVTGSISQAQSGMAYIYIPGWTGTTTPTDTWTKTTDTSGIWTKTVDATDTWT